MLLDDESFVGCVRLPVVNGSQTDVCNTLENASSAQGDTNIPYTHSSRGWSCALWIIRELNKLEEQGLISLGLPKWSSAPKFYMETCGRGIQLQEQAGGTVIDDIRVINL